MESDADRLAMLRSLGGISVEGPRCQFIGVLDLVPIGVGEVPVNTVAPMLTARTSDLARAGVTVGAQLTANEEQYIVRSLRKDGLGMTELDLEIP